MAQTSQASQSSVGGASTFSQGGLEGIAELLQCYICTEGLKDTSLCPHCCKLVCFNCIKRWITDNRADCPHCRVALTLRELVKMPLFDELVEFVEDLRSKQEDANRSPSNEVQMCPSHSHKLSVYCESCHQSICHECALWSNDHKGHSFKPLDVLYQKHKQALEAELYRLKDRMRDILSFVLQVEKRVEGIKGNKSKTRREIQHVMEKMYSRVDTQAKDKLTKLADCRHFLRSQAVKVMRAAHDLEGTMASGSYSSILNDDGQLKNELRETLDKLYSNSLKMEALSGNSGLTNEVVPLYDTATFKITPFKDLQRKGEEIYSDPLTLGGLTWRLKVYPNGHHEDIGRYLAVFMELSEGYDKITSYQYCIEMLYNGSDKYPQRNYTRDYVSDFGDGECWGYRKYYQLARLASEGYLKDDTLVLRFSVRNITYHDKCRDMSIYVERVRSERDTLRQQLKESQKQISSLKTDNKKLMASSQSVRRPRSSPTHSRGEPKPQRRISPRSSRLHPPYTSHSSQHSHSHSDPHSESPRNTSRKHDDLRRTSGYPISASQQALASPHHTSHTPHTTHGSPKRSGYSKHPDDHLMYAHRRSHDMDKRSLIERRRSADPAVNFDPRGQESGGSENESIESGRYQRMRGHGHMTDRHMFEDSSSDQGGSQPISTEEIYIGLQEDDNASSASTLTAAGSPPRWSRQDLSQAEFNEEDHRDPPLLSEPETVIQYLSQSSSPPKTRHGKSLTDIHNLTTNSLSHSQQFLSQSIAEFPHYHHWDGGSYYTMADTSRHEKGWYHDGRFRRPIAKPSLSASHGQIFRMRSDPHLNFDPGAPSSKTSHLKKVTEEVEQRETRRRGAGQHQGRSRGSKGQHLGRKHLNATLVNETSVQQSTKSSTRQAPPPSLQSRTDDSADKVMATLTVNESKQTSQLSLGAGGKSNSTSSLNLSQIL